MKIMNIKGLSAVDLEREAEKGARFVYYTFIVSLLLVTFKRTSGVYMIRGGESAVSKGNRFTIISALFGWWGIPFGPKHSIKSIRSNLRGGKDVTDEVMSTVAGHILFREAQQRKKTG
ncbi:MAG TPA: hypothetical protein VMZ03_02670 [Chitinophagaceae bacterium]|nr:hypothetical protein [Chitinophagaceae bacterium]